MQPHALTLSHSPRLIALLLPGSLQTNIIHARMLFEFPSENLLNLVKRHQNKGVPMLLVRQIAKQVSLFGIHV